MAKPKFNLPKIPGKFKSRKFLLAIASAVIVFLNKAYDWGLDEKEVLLIIGSLLSFILVEGVADIKRAK